MLGTKPTERTVQSRQARLMLRPCGPTCTDVKFSGLGDGQRQKTEGRAQSPSFHKKHLTHGSMETHQCGQLTWPRVEANEIFVKSF